MVRTRDDDVGMHKRNTIARVDDVSDETETTMERRGSRYKIKGIMKKKLLKTVLVLMGYLLKK